MNSNNEPLVQDWVIDNAIEIQPPNDKYQVESVRTKTAISFIFVGLTLILEIDE